MNWEELINIEKMPHLSSGITTMSDTGAEITIEWKRWSDRIVVWHTMWTHISGVIENEDSEVAYERLSIDLNNVMIGFSKIIRGVAQQRGLVDGYDLQRGAIEQFFNQWSLSVKSRIYVVGHARVVEDIADLLKKMTHAQRSVGES